MVGDCCLEGVCVRRGWRAWTKVAVAACLLVLVLSSVLGPRVSAMAEVSPSAATASALAAKTSSSAPETSVIVRAIQFSGEAELLSDVERAELEAAAAGQPLDLAALQALANRATQMLQAKGRLLARAYLPPQDVTAGIVEIAVVEGSVEEWHFSLSDAVRIRPDRLEAIAYQVARPGESFTRQALERALLLMSDQAGVTARARLESGERPNTTRVIVDVDQRKAVSGSASVNNYGSLSTGSLQGSVSLNLDDTLSWGEQFQLHANFSRGIRMLRAGANVGLGGAGLRLNGRATSMTYALVEGDVAAADPTGDSRSWHVDLSYPWVRSRALNVRGSLSYDQKALIDRVGGEVTRARHARVWGAGLSGDVSQGGAYTGWGLVWSSGVIDIIEGTDPQFSAGSFTKIEANVSRVHTLRPALTLAVRALGQWAGKNLDSSEKFSLGGPSGIRAYPPTEASGDAGWLASVELRYDVALPSSWGALQLMPFFDTGRIQLYRHPIGAIETATGQNVYSLAGAGLEVTWRPPARGTSSPVRSTITLGWAHALGDNPGRTIHGTNADGTTRQSRLWAQASINF